MTHFFRDGSAFTGSAADIARGFTVIRTNCGKCGGTGNIPSYRHVEGGVCFQCNGNGRAAPQDRPLYTAEKLAQLNVTAAKRLATKVAKADAARSKAQAETDVRRADFLTAYGPLVAWLEVAGRDRDGDYREGFLGDMLQRATVSANWSEAQATAVQNSFAKAQERNAVRAGSRHVGTIGQRIDVVVIAEGEAEYERPRFVPSYHGSNSETVYITTLRTADGSAIVVKSPSFRAVKGDTLTVRGTVKEHNEFRGEAQTILSRAKITNFNAEMVA